MIVFDMLLYTFLERSARLDPFYFHFYFQTEWVWFLPIDSNIFEYLEPVVRGENGG